MKNIDASVTMISTMTVVIQTSFQVGQVTLADLLADLLKELERIQRRHLEADLPTSDLRQIPRDRRSHHDDPSHV